METLEQVTEKMVRDRSTWPYSVLPLKNYKHKGLSGLARLGYIASSAVPYQVKAGNVFKPAGTDPVIASYATVKDLVDSGWVVD